MSEHLHHKLDVLRQNLLHGKLPRSVRWDDALELIEHLGRVEAHGGEEFAFVVGAQRELFKRPHGQDLGIDEVSRLRKFLKAASAEPLAAERAQPRTVVVIDHHSARIFGGGQPDVALKPYDPHHFHHHLIHKKEAHYEGERVPEETSFYEQIAAALASGPGDRPRRPRRGEKQRRRGATQPFEVASRRCGATSQESRRRWIFPR